MIVVICGVSGAGKTVIVSSLLQVFPNSGRIESYTVRLKRETDPQGEYIHVSDEEFKALDSSGFFLWKVGPFGSKYGTAKSSIKSAAEKKSRISFITLIPNIIIFDLLEKFTDSLGGVDIMYCYILSPGPDIIRKRLSKPGRDNEDMEKRIKECANWDDWAKREYLTGRIPFIFVSNDKEGDITEPANFILNSIMERIRTRMYEDKKCR